MYLTITVLWLATNDSLLLQPVPSYYQQSNNFTMHEI
jgi:hypothetical protein